MSQNNIDEILNLINTALTQSFTVKVWVPSLIGTDLEYINFKPLNVEQQRKLVATSLKSDIYNSSFITEFYNIIVNNFIPISNKPTTVNFLTVLDKIFIALYLRSNINTHYTFNIKDIAIDLDLNSIINNLKNIITPDLISSKTFQHENISIVCALPSILTELQCESGRETLTENIELEEQIHSIILDTVSNELTKFSSRVVIDSNIIDFNSYSFIERKKILNQLPANILQNVLNYTINYKQVIEQALTISGSNNELDSIQINGSFFATL